VVADKVHRDQRRIGDMRQNLVRTQKQLKHIRELILESPESPLSQPIHDAVEDLITHNRRVNYRVEPPTAATGASFRLDAGTAEVHRAVAHPRLGDLAGPHRCRWSATWLAGVLDLGGTELPAPAARSSAVDGKRVTIELDLFIDAVSRTSSRAT
jgi:CRP/FNR family cyclic AMP-dependent transcriptional regulator